LAPPTLVREHWLRAR